MTIDGIERRRAEARLTQKELCRRAGVHPTTYSQVKRGRRDAYSRTLQKLSAALDDLARERSSQGPVPREGEAA